MPESSSMILGIDPGTNFLGYALLEVRGADLLVRESGVVTMTHLPDAGAKLRRIFTKIEQLILQHQPHHLAIEAPFFGKNVQSMLKLGRAQGVAIAAALSAGLDYTEYAPRRIKQAVTGKGNATKDQVAAMLEQILKIPVRKTMTDDASDALAVAICHHYQVSGPMGKVSGSGQGWKAFLRENPNRVIKKGTR